MLGNCDKIITPSCSISSTTNINQWPQKQIVVDDHHQSLMASSSSSNKAMAADKQINQDHHLNCPRCDSSNTKFCYYNNYSLSQPRHFCKACKRHWTRGGTLRNVPVGGGCRKNKRPKRHSAAAATTTTTTAPPPSTHVQNPLGFYGLPTNPLELNFPFSSFRVSSSDNNNNNTGFDLHHPQFNALGLGFSSGMGMMMETEASNNNGFQDAIITNSSSSPFSNSIFFGSSSSSSSSTMTSLLASKDTIPGLMPYEDPQIPGMGSKQVKSEGVLENRLPWNPNHPIDQINSSDPSSLLWNTTTIAAWFDPSSMGSSVPSLI
ncbi:hypothetical protein C2S51_012091 [Perilla frutescens var. frutescens]|nr:hypothetical protein C2S51_012091 [Perilla frutescens var. frutescens]